MKQNKAQVARKIDELMLLRKRMHKLLDRANMLTLAIKAAKGGESKRYVAMLVRVKAYVVKVRAHKRLDIQPKA